MSAKLLAKKSTKRVLIQNHGNMPVYIGGKNLVDNSGKVDHTKALKLNTAGVIEIKGHKDLYIVGNNDLVSVVYI